MELYDKELIKELSKSYLNCLENIGARNSGYFGYPPLDEFLLKNYYVAVYTNRYVSIDGYCITLPQG